jgi:hypothetical protein
MGTINLDDTRPGMVLAREARDLQGRVLVAAGVALTEKHLRILKIWGVSGLEIAGVDQQEVDEEALSQVDPALVEAAERETKAHFAFADATHPAIVELMRLAVLHALRPAERGVEP